MSKKEDFFGKEVVLGFDESNNGYGLKVFNPHHKPAMVLTGYLAEDTSMKSYHSPPNEIKGKIFTGQRNIEEALKRGRSYIRDHPDFLYTAIPKELQRTVPIAILKAEAIATLTINFFLHYHLDPSKTKIVMDEMDGELPSKQLNQVLDIWLEKAGLDIPHKSLRSSPSQVLAVRKADMISYYLAAIHLLGDNPHWPYKHHRVGIRSLEKSLIELLEERETDYPHNLRNGLIIIKLLHKT